MEYNKDEALRAKEIAESKFMAHDLAGAKKFALKAQQLYPSLEGLAQTMAILDVHIAAENKVNGQTDWYAILQVDFVAEEAIIKKQYRKLALMLHPDKNKSVGAEGAFKLIGEAWGVLSDKIKRSVYDHKRNYGGFQQTQSIQKPQKPAPAPPATANNGYFNFPSQPKAASTSPAMTFWTACPFCKMQYEYPRSYINRNLLCPNCQKAFLAFEVRPIPRNGAYQPKFTGAAFSHMASGAFAGVPRGGASQNANCYAQNVFSGASNPAAATGAAWDAYEKAKNGPAKKKEETPKKNQTKKEKVASGANKSTTEKARKKKKQKSSSDTDDLTATDDDEDVVEIAKPKETPKKRAPKVDVEENPSRKRGRKVDKKDAMESPLGKKGQKVDETEVGEDPSQKSGHPETITVPDSDFHDFDKDRTEDAFKPEQIWAVYDDDDGMPRFYARILKVFSVGKFKVKMSWLEAVPNKEKALSDWLDAGFYQGCGDFKTAKVVSNDVLNVFSHVIAWEKGPKGVIRIFPRKGEVWALYRHWSSTWDESTPPEQRHKYEMVEILDDFIEEMGVNVAPLVKVDGFKTVFQKKQEVHSVHKNELLRFSHQVPAKRLMGEESPNLPKYCWDLDPAATPMDLSAPEDEGKAAG